MQTNIISTIGWAIFTTLIVLSLSGCGGGGGDGSGITVSGTVTLPASVIDREWYVAIDNDHDGDNGAVAIATGFVTGSTFNYSLGNVPPGDYFIYGLVYITGTPGPPSPGDYVGDGCVLIDSPCKVTIDSSKTVDFTLVVWPGSGGSLTITGASGSQVEMDGSWSAGCRLDSDGSDMLEEFTTISGSSFSITGDVWVGAVDCSGAPEASTIYRGTFTLGDEVAVLLNGIPVNATKKDVVVTTALYTLYTADLITLFNNNGACGATDWVIGTAKEVVGTNCEPTSYKDIVYIDDTVDPDLMYDGDKGAVGADGYPTVVDVGSAAARLSAHELLNGTWATVCGIIDPVSSNNIVYVFNDGVGSGTHTTYNDNLCSPLNIISVEPATFTYIFGSNVTVDGSVSGITTATQIDITETTQGSATLGEITYDIGAIKDLTTLYLGDDSGTNDGSTAALRPTQLDGLFPLTKL